MTTVHRRAVLGALATAVGCSLLGTTSLSRTLRAAEPPVPALPVRVRVAGLAAPAGEESPAVTDAFVTLQMTQANALFAPHGIAFVEVAPRDAIAASHGRLESPADRNALAAHLTGGAIEVFFVGSLRDIDPPHGLRMGVTWRKLTDLSKKYVIVSADAAPSVLAHEIGHFLGNGHSAVRNNLMSYDRDGGEVSLDATQGRISRRTARSLLARKVLVPAA